MALLYALRLLTFAWVLAGAVLVPSSSDWDPEKKEYRKVRQCHLSTATWYQGFTWRDAMLFLRDGPPAACVPWLMDRDRATRAKAKTLYASGMSWGEAMVNSANTDCLVLWQTSKSGKGPVRALSDGLVEEEEEENADMELDGQSAKRQRVGAMKVGKGPRGVCPKFSSSAGCTSSEKDPRVPAWWRRVCGA